MRWLNLMRWQMGRRRNAVQGLVASAAAVLTAFCLPAAAQFWGDNWPDQQRNRYPDDRYQQQQRRDDFFPFGKRDFIRPPPVVDSTKAPSSRKLETPPSSTVVVIG